MSDAQPLLVRYAGFRQECQDLLDKNEQLGLFGPMFVDLYDALQRLQLGYDARGKTIDAMIEDIEEMRAELEQLRAQLAEARKWVPSLEVGSGVLSFVQPLIDTANEPGEEEAWTHLQEAHNDE